jgi:hypothetical protein
MSEAKKLLVSVRVQLNHLALGTLLTLLQLEPLKHKGELEIGFDNGEPYVWVGPTARTDKEQKYLAAESN